MVKLDNVTEGVLDVINDNKFSQTGAFNLRENGTSICHGDSEHIKIKKRQTSRALIFILMENGRRGCLYPGSAQQIRHDRPCIQRFLC